MSAGMSVGNIVTGGHGPVPHDEAVASSVSSYCLEGVVAAGVAGAGVEVVLALSLGDEELLALASEDFGFALP